MTEGTGGGVVARARARIPEPLADAFIDAAWLWLVLRVGLGILAVLVVVGGSAAAPCPTDPPLRFLPGEGIGYLLFGVWHHWDGCWYTTIAAFGYGDGGGATTFFPLFPWIVGALAGVRGAIAPAAAVVNAVALIVAFTGLRLLVERDFDRPIARRTVFYTAIFPAAFFLVAPFTEALFLAASVWAFWGARTRRWEIAFVAGFAAGLSRPLGVILVLPLAWEALSAIVARARAGGPRFRPADVLTGVAAAGPAIGYLVFVAYTAVVVGDSYFASHARWGEHQLILPWDRLAQAVAYAIDHHHPVQLINAVFWCLFALLTLVGIRRLPVSYWLYVLPQLVLALTQDTVWPMMSAIRYFLVLFPCFIVLAMAGGNRRFHLAWTVVSLLLLGYLTVQFVEGAMVG